MSRIAAALARTYRATLYGSSGTLSMGRLLVVFGILQVAASFWLFVAWVWFVTATGQMEAASPLAASIGTILSSVLSSQVAAIAATWWTTKRYGSAGAASFETVNDPNATAPESAGPGGI